jgi:hypothetical protein
MNQRQLRADINAGAEGPPTQLNARRARLVNAVNRFVIQTGLGLAGTGPHLTQRQAQNLAAARRAINAINRRRRILAIIATVTAPGHSPRSLREFRENLREAPLNAAEAREAIQRINSILNSMPNAYGKNWLKIMRRKYPGKRITPNGAKNWVRAVSRTRSATRSASARRTPSARRAKSA